MNTWLVFHGYSFKVSSVYKNNNSPFKPTEELWDTHWSDKENRFCPIAVHIKGSVTQVIFEPFQCETIDAICAF